MTGQKNIKIAVFKKNWCWCDFFKRNNGRHRRIRDYSGALTSDGVFFTGKTRAKHLRSQTGALLPLMTVLLTKSGNAVHCEYFKIALSTISPFIPVCSMASATIFNSFLVFVRVILKKKTIQLDDSPENYLVVEAVGRQVKDRAGAKLRGGEKRVSAKTSQTCEMRKKMEVEYTLTVRSR